MTIAGNVRRTKRLVGGGDAAVPKCEITDRGGAHEGRVGSCARLWVLVD